MRARCTVLAAVLALAACADSPTWSTAAGNPLAAISDGASGGNSHFYFLPPMVPNPTPTGVADAALDPEVVICTWDGSACGVTLATFTTDLATTTTTQPGNSETVRRSGSHYIVDWHTGRFDLDVESTYRVCVRVGGVALGFADVDVVASGASSTRSRTGFVGVVNGRTLPIKFRIEQGAVEQGSAGACGGSGDT